MKGMKYYLSSEKSRRILANGWAIALAIVLVTDLRAGGLDPWHWHNPLPRGTNLNSVAFGNGLFVAVGDQGRTAISSDGENWMPGNTGFGATLSGLTFGNGSFVAVGGNMVYSSTNGTNWIQHNPGANDGLVAITYGNGSFIAVGGGLLSRANVAVSTNLTVWSIGSSRTPTALRAIAYGEAAWLYNGGVFRAVGDQGAGAYTQDGISSWTSGSFPTSLNLFGVAYGPEGFISVGQSGYITGDIQSATSGTTNDLQGVVFHNDMYIAVGLGGTILASTNGYNWSLLSSGTTNGLRAVTYGNGQIVAVGDNGTVGAAAVLETSLGLQRNSLKQLILFGPIGHSLQIESVDEFTQAVNWTSMVTVTLTNRPQVWTDTRVAGVNRYYRSILLP